MSRFKSGALFATMISSLWISGCVTAPPKEETAELQLAAIERWSACLERHTANSNSAMLEVSKIMNHDCEGYKRDVVALFPPHLAGQVDEMLVQSAYQHIDSAAGLNPPSSESEELIRAALR